MRAISFSIIFLVTCSVFATAAALLQKSVTDELSTITLLEKPWGKPPKIVMKNPMHPLIIDSLPHELPVVPTTVTIPVCTSVPVIPLDATLKDTMVSIGLSSSFTSRHSIAADMGIMNYQGTPDQNAALLVSIRGLYLAQTGCVAALNVPRTLNPST